MKQKITDCIYIFMKSKRIRKVSALVLVSICSIVILACDRDEIRDEVRTEAYNYAKTRVDDCNLTKGQDQVQQQGKNGTKEIREEVTYTNGEETNRKLISETIITQPVNEILIVGGLEVRQVPENQPLAFNTVYRENPNVPKGEEKVIQEGKNGTQTVTYEVVYKCGIPEPDKKPVGVPKVITPAVDRIIERGTKSISNCDPNYSGCCVPIASDVDCAGGSGNGPAYVSGPCAVVGYDIYGLDRDGDGVGCE